MKELKIEDIMPLEEVKSKIWIILDVLRSENISSNDYYVVLFLLSAFKDGLISGKISSEDQSLQKSLIEQLYSSNNVLFDQYAPIIECFEPSIHRLSENGIRHIFDVFAAINKKVLTENFPNLFDSILYRISKSQGRSAGEFIQPVELTRFMCGLADLKKNDKVFNPFAGLASFGVYLEQGQYYFGQELNQKTWALGALRLIAYKRPGISEYVCDDSIFRWPKATEKFDLIISNPPFNIKFGKQDGSIDHDFRTIEQLLIEKGLHSLNQNGKLIALLPQGFLFRGMQEQRLREHLVKEDIIETVISLPGGLLLNTGIPLIILVLNRSKKLGGKVKFVDATNFVVANGSKEKVLNDYRLNSFIHGDREDENIVRLVDIKQIRDNDYNLSVGRYFQKKIEGVKLGDILELVRGQRGNLPKKGKLIRIRDLKDDKVDYTINVSKIEETVFSRPDIHLVSESCLLLAVRWKNLKPTLFEFEGEHIFRSQDILSFKVNESRVDKAYLINELHADYILEQVESYRLGASVMAFIRKEDLMQIVIKLPSLEAQRAKVLGIYELTDKIKNLQQERNALAHGKSIKQFNEFASLKHTLGRPRQNILDWSDNLLDFLNKKKEGFDELNKDFTDFYDIDIISVLKEIKRDVNFITDVLEKGENGLVLSEYEKQIISLSDINSIINELSNNGFNFKINKLLLKGERLKYRGVFANETLFKTLLDNIFTNANKYAFDKKTLGNEVVIELTEVDDFLFLEIRNNGKAFPKNFDRDKFITKYSTADTINGTGLGGYDINRIAADLNNPNWILSLNEDPFFPVKFKFQFPIKMIN